MGNFTWLYDNYIDTTTSISVTSGTATAYKLIDDRPASVWRSVGEIGAESYVTVSFSSTQTIDTIFLQNTSMDKNGDYIGCQIYNGAVFVRGIYTESATANYFFSFSSSSCTKISLYFYKASSPAQSIGQLYAGLKRVELTRNPDKTQYSPTETRTQKVHEMSDGGIALFNIDTKFQAEVDLSYLSQTVADDIETMVDDGNSVYFAPFPVVSAGSGGGSTSEQWLGEAYNVLLFGDNSLKGLAGNNYQCLGREGVLTMREVAK